MSSVSGGGPLPRGRHRLSREQVVASQRDRMIAAMAEAVAEKGFAASTVGDVVRRAGVSRETFYEQFEDKEACFRAAYGAGVDRVVGAVTGALAEARDPTRDGPAARFDRALAAYLDVMQRDPALAHTFLIDVYAAGPAAIEQRMVLQGRFVDLMADVLGLSTPRDRFACEALVAAVSSLVTNRVGSGRTAEIRALHGPLMDVFHRLMGHAGREAADRDPSTSPEPRPGAAT